jgi:hypothetical protein
VVVLKQLPPKDDSFMAAQCKVNSAIQTLYWTLLKESGMMKSLTWCLDRLLAFTIWYNGKKERWTNAGKPSSEP